MTALKKEWNSHDRTKAFLQKRKSKVRQEIKQMRTILCIKRESAQLLGGHI